MEPVVVAVLIGIAAYMLVVALIPTHILAESSGYTRSQLQQLERQAAGVPVTDETGSILREQITHANLITRIFFTLPGAKAAYPRLLKADLTESLDKFFISFLILFLLLVYALKGTGIWSVAIALAVTYFIAWRYVERRVRKRNEAFLNLFPDALDMIVRSVRSGYPLSAALRIVAENMQPPVSTEFKRVADETAYGSPLMDALTRLSYRIDEPDIRFFVVVLAVQQEVGGNLAEVLSNLSGIIRKRKHLRLKVKALTSEGRATAWVLGLLPAFEFGAIYLVAPDHLTPFFTTLLGNLILASAIGIVLLGAFIVKHMVNMEV
jgi:tight adherence protein B